MSTDSLVVRLRTYVADMSLCSDYCDAMLEAADEIERLRAYIRSECAECGGDAKACELGDCLKPMVPMTPNAANKARP